MNETYVIKFGKYKGRKFICVPLVHFHPIFVKLVKRQMRHGGRL